MLTLDLTPAIAIPGDPANLLYRLVTQAQHIFTAYAPILLPATVGVAAAVALVAYLARQRRHAALARDARTVVIVPPPEVDPGGGQALWTNLMGLLRPAWRRLLAGQPHLAFEYTWTPAGVQIQLWVPGTVPPGLIEAAVEAAWPGARTTVAPAKPPLPAATCSTGGKLRLARVDHYPLRHTHDTDPSVHSSAPPATSATASQGVCRSSPAPSPEHGWLARTTPPAR